ncbi:MAG: SDR family NAD(P)-dependent oxidoreductase, partial [Chitinivibrionales bacterium]|nr:SDR family NAD(P)-dependent oxidoreductase [Chitinivibrionales bacterium]
ANQVALVTGSGRGVGRGIAMVLAGRGATVVVTARTKSEIDETVELIKKKGGHAIALTASVIDENDVSGLVHTIEEKFGGLDILVNNAGSFDWIGPLWDADPEMWWRDVTINLKGTFLCCRYAVPLMIKKRAGVVITLNGGGAEGYFLYGSSYASSKAAVLRFTEQLARELIDQGNENVLAYAVGPGLVVTRMSSFQTITSQGLKYMPGTKKNFDAGNVKKPEECGKLCAWLAQNRPHEFSGRIFDVADNIDDVWAHKEKIVNGDARLLRGQH